MLLREENDVWRKSSYSNPNGECLEVDDTGWAKSSYSAASECLEWRKASSSFSNGNCVECMGICQCHAGPGILVRDSKLGDDSPILSFTPAAWKKFTRTIGDRARTARD